MQRQCEELRDKISLRVLSKSHPDGLLTHGAEAYLDCVSIETKRLDELLTIDEHHWKENLREAKEAMATFKANLKALLDRQNQEIEAALEMDLARRKYTLKKLALWGE